MNAVGADQPVETPSDLATTQSSNDYEDCCYGAFTCPSNPAIIRSYTSHLVCKDFETTFYPAAASSCRTACGAPCTDSGWSCPLLAVVGREAGCHRLPRRRNSPHGERGASVETAQRGAMSLTLRVLPQQELRRPSSPKVEPPNRGSAGRPRGSARLVRVGPGTGPPSLPLALENTAEYRNKRVCPPPQSRASGPRPFAPPPCRTSHPPRYLDHALPHFDLRPLRGGGPAHSRSTGDGAGRPAIGRGQHQLWRRTGLDTA